MPRSRYKFPCTPQLTFASSVCLCRLSSDVRALVALLNAPHPRWQVALDLLIDAVQSEHGITAASSSSSSSSSASSPSVPIVSAASVGPYVQFHLARRGLACLHLPLLSHAAERAWPPSSGYTVAAWLCVDSFGGDADALRVLSLASSDSKSLTDAYIMRRVLTLQTAANQRVELSAFRFEPGRWCAVHLVCFQFFDDAVLPNSLVFLLAVFFSLVSGTTWCSRTPST